MSESFCEPKRMTRPEYHRQFAELDYDAFRRMATDSTLTANEKAGFPIEYRDGLANVIVEDILSKLPGLHRNGERFLDIGCGCGELTQSLLALSSDRNCKSHLIDSAEMLCQLNPPASVQRHTGRFPQEMSGFIESHAGQFDSILVYSVIQYVFNTACVFAFLDSCLALLASGGRCLIGDIPNRSMRKRFFGSAAGIKAHQEFTQSSELPVVIDREIVHGHIDDAVLLGLVSRARSAGFHAFILPQYSRLPMSTRREDLLIVKP